MALTVQSGGAVSDPVTVVAGPDVVVNGDGVSVAAHNSPTIVTSPAYPGWLVVADKIDRPGFSAALHVSKDGGRNWTDVPFPVPAGEDRPYAPDLAWSPDGTLYLAFVTLAGRGNSPDAVWISSSQDGGRNWARPRRVLGSHAFQVRLALDPGSGALHLTWLQASDALCVNCFSKTGLPILASRSTDGGATWSRPARVSSPSRERVGAPTPAVGRDGELYVLYQDFKDDRFLWQDLGGARYGGTYELVLSVRSRDARAFREAVVEPRVVPSGDFLVYLPKNPSLAVDPASGELYAAWADSRSGSPDVYVRRSQDGGASWTRPQRVHPPSETDQYLPRVSVAPGGRVDVAYLDRRHDPKNVLTAASFATSLDSGQSWSSIVLSKELFDSTVGPHYVLRGQEQPEADQGTRLGLVSWRDQAGVVWTDARRGTGATGKLDIRYSEVRFRTP